MLKFCNKKKFIHCTFLRVNNNGTDQTAWMSWLVCAFVLTHKKIRPRGYKTFFMLNSTEQEISTAHKN